MSEEIFRGTIEVDTDITRAGEKLELFNSQLDSLSNDAIMSAEAFLASAQNIANGISSVAARYVDENIVGINRLDTEVKDFGTAVESALEPSKTSFQDLLSLFRLGIRQIDSESGNLIAGLRIASSAMEQLTGNVPALEGVHRVFSRVNRVVSNFTKNAVGVSRIMHRSDRDMYRLAISAQKLSYELTIQKTGWRELERQTNQNIESAIKIIEELKVLQVRFKQFSQIQAIVSNAVGKGFSNAQYNAVTATRLTREEINRLNEELSKFGLTVEGVRSLDRDFRKAGITISSVADLQRALTQAIQDTTTQSAEFTNELNKLRRESEAVFKQSGIEEFNYDIQDASRSLEQMEYQEGRLADTHKIRTRLQSQQQALINAAFSRMRSALRYVESAMKSTGEVSAKYLSRARVEAETFQQVLNRFKQIGGTLPPQMQQTFGRVSEIIEASTVEVHRQLRETQDAMDGLPKRGGRIKRFLEGINKALRTTGKSAEGYKEDVRGANLQNTMLQRLVAPEGALNSGLTHIGSTVLMADKSINTFSISLGTAIGAIGALGGALGQIDPAFATIIVGASRMADQFARSFAAMAAVSGDAAQRIRAAIGILSNTMIAFGLTATGVIVKSGLLGAKAKTLEITLLQIAKNLAREAGADVDKFGEHILDLRNKIRDAGIETTEATVALTQFLRARLPIGRVEELANAAKNLGVTVANMTSSQVFGRFIEFIVRGNSQLLDAIGIVKTASQMYEDYGKEIGKSGKALTSHEQLLARINGLLKETEGVQGVYNEAMKTAGKQLSSMTRLFKEAILVLGSRFEPILAKMIESMNKLLKWFVKLDPKIQDQIANFIKWVAVVGTLYGTIIALVPALKSLIPVVRALGLTISKAIPGLLLVSAVIGSVMIVVKSLRRLWEENFAGIQDSVKDLAKTLKDALGPLIGWIKSWFDIFARDIENIIRTVTDILKTWVEDFANALRDARSKVAFYVQSIADIFGGFARTIHNILVAFNEMLKGNTEEAGQKMRDAFLDGLTVIRILIEDWISKAAIWGFKLVANFARGMVAAEVKIIQAAMEIIGYAIGLFLAPGSPPKKGPLSHIVEWGRGIMETYLRAFSLADFGILKSAMAPIQQALEDAVAAGKIGEKVVYPLIGRVRTMVTELIADLRATGKVNEEIMADISDTLGEGGRDIVVYIRRLIAHQRALENLSKVQQEISEAQAAGFVSQELQQRLENAQDEVDATKDALDWQKEFLDAQRDTISLQLKYLKALERTEKAVKDIADKLDDLKLDLDLGKIGEELKNWWDEITGNLKTFSERFKTSREEIEKWLAAPVEEKLKGILTWILELVGFEFPEDWDTLSWTQAIDYLIDLALESIKEKLPEWKEKVIETLKDWGGAFWEGFMESVKGSFAEKEAKITTSIGSSIYSAISKLKSWVAFLSYALASKFDDIFEGAAKIMGVRRFSISAWIAYTIGYYMGLGIKLFTETIPRLSNRLRFAIMRLLTLSVILLSMKIVEFAKQLAGVFYFFTHLSIIEFLKFIPKLAWAMFLTFATLWGKFVQKLTKFAWLFVRQLIKWILSEVIYPWSRGLLEAGPEWLRDFAKVGSKIVGAIWSGIEDVWDKKIKEPFMAKLQELLDLLPLSEPKDRSSPLYGLSRVGKAIANNIGSGFDFSGLNKMVKLELAGFSDQFARVGTNNYNRTQVFERGAFEGAFPNVANGNDALAFMDQLDAYMQRNRAKSFIGAA